MVNLNQKLKLTRQCPTFQKGSVAHTTVSGRRMLQVSGKYRENKHDYLTWKTSLYRLFKL